MPENALALTAAGGAGFSIAGLIVYFLVNSVFSWGGQTSYSLSCDLAEVSANIVRQVCACRAGKAGLDVPSFYSYGYANFPDLDLPHCSLGGVRAALGESFSMHWEQLQLPPGSLALLVLSIVGL